MTTPPILDRLRAETGAAHTQLEETVSITRRLESPAAYAALLQKFLGFYRPLEPQLCALEGWADWGLDMHGRQKVAWLEQDLSAMGYAASQIGEMPSCENLPEIRSLAQGFGCAYVLEGSTLGGRHISALLQNSALPAGARHFFASYGPSVGERWKEFVAALGHFAEANDAGADAIVHTACDTFASLQSWIGEGGTIVP